MSNGVFHPNIRKILKIIVLVSFVCLFIFCFINYSLKYYIAHNTLYQRLRTYSLIGTELFTTSEYDYAKIYRRPLDNTVAVPEFNAINQLTYIDDNESIIVFYYENKVIDVFKYPLNIQFITADMQLINYIELSKKECQFQVQEQNGFIFLILCCSTPDCAITTPL